MKTIKIPFNEKILLPSSDYYSEALKHPAPKHPEIWRVDGGSAVLMFPDRVYMWITPVNLNSFETEDTADTKTQLTQQSNSAIIDGNVLLKAIAIAQNPTLATQLIKE